MRRATNRNMKILLLALAKAIHATIQKLREILINRMRKPNIPLALAQAFFAFRMNNKMIFPLTKEQEGIELIFYLYMAKLKAVKRASIG